MSGATYYVSPSGNDGNPGSGAAPFLTIQAGVNAAQAGDTVVIMDGTYGPGNAVTGGDDADFEASPVWLYNSGTPSAPITIQAEHKGAAILDCQLTCDSYINLYNASYVIIENLVIARGYKEGIHSNDSAHHITLEGNEIEYIANRATDTPYGLPGMYTNPNCHDFIINGNKFHDIGRTSGTTLLDHGLYLHGTNFTLTNNVFFDIPNGWDIQMADGLTNVTIANNTFVFGNPNEPGQIMMWNTQNDVDIENNIFYSPQSVAITRFASTVNGCTITNNLVYGASGMISDPTGCSMGASFMGVDPLFVNITTYPYDFHLQANSPAIGAGAILAGMTADLDGVARPANQPSDLGAYEYSAPGSIQLTNTSTGGGPTFSPGDSWAATVSGALPNSPVMATVGSWTGFMGMTDSSGNISVSGVVQPATTGVSYSEVWSVGGVAANPSPVTITINP